MHAFACATVSLMGCGEPTSRADQLALDPAALKRGKAIFTGTCAGYCHGTSPGPRDAPYLFDCVWNHGGSDAEVFNTISEGVPDTRMVSFGGKLPEGDEDIWRLVAYLKSKRAAC